EASLRKEGAWPNAERTVSLELRGVPRGEAVKQLADQAGWSLVFTSPPSDPVDVVLKQQQADKALQVLLSNGSYVARRDGAIVSIATDAASAQSAEPSASSQPSAAAPAPPRDAAKTDADTRGRDREVTGGSVRIEKGETVHNVEVLGGSVDVWGN